MHDKDKAQDPVETLREKIKDMRMVMLSTLSNGRIVTRPMATQDVGDDGILRFLTGAESNKVDELEDDPRVGLAYSDHDAASYVSVAGTARLTNDRALIKKFWNPLLKAWFDGPDDPNIRVIEVRPNTAEYWTTSGGKFVSLASVFVSAVTGKEMEGGKNEELVF